MPMLSAANQNTALAEVYEQVTYAPVFGGFREHKFLTNFMDHMQRANSLQKTEKTIREIETSLMEILQELKSSVLSGKLDTVCGTVP